MTVEDVAKHLGVKHDTIYKWITRRGFPAHKAGRLWRFQRSEIDKWVVQGGSMQLEAFDETLNHPTIVGKVKP
nr:helix-turn-helix domain-containing protein [Pseudorhodobacter aquimaris]